MNSDLLLHWATHRGEGSWAGFRRAVAELNPGDPDMPRVVRKLRIALSDLGHIDFFVGGTERWSVLRPAIGGLSSDQGAAVLCGGRTPGMIAALRCAAVANGCQLDELAGEYQPTICEVTGDSTALAAVAHECGLQYVASIATALCQEVDPIRTVVMNAPQEDPPVNWEVRSFDFDSMSWLDGLRSRSACESLTQRTPMA